MPAPLVLESAAVVNVDPPLAAGLVVVPLHIVALAVPVPTLDDGRPT